MSDAAHRSQAAVSIADTKGRTVRLDGLSWGPRDPRDAPCDDVPSTLEAQMYVAAEVDISHGRTFPLAPIFETFRRPDATVIAQVVGNGACMLTIRTGSLPPGGGECLQSRGGGGGDWSDEEEEDEGGKDRRGVEEEGDGGDYDDDDDDGGGDIGSGGDYDDDAGGGSGSEEEEEGGEEEYLDCSDSEGERRSRVRRRGGRGAARRWRRRREARRGRYLQSSPTIVITRAAYTSRLKNDRELFDLAVAGSYERSDELVVVPMVRDAGDTRWWWGRLWGRMRRQHRRGPGARRRMRRRRRKRLSFSKWLCRLTFICVPAVAVGAVICAKSMGSRSPFTDAALIIIMLLKECYIRMVSSLL